MIRIEREEQVLQDPAIRKLIIEDINGPENTRRKNEAYRRHQCYKDKTSIYVIKELLQQFDDTTVKEMNYSLSNISIAKKIIDKLARVYTNGVQRNVTPETAQENVDKVAKLVSMNKIMKRTNRYLRAQHNTIVGTLPCPKIDNGVVKYEIKVQAFQPHLYDVIEDPYDREKPMFIILSNYKPQVPVQASLDAATQNRGKTTASLAPISDGKDQSIADKKEDEDQGEYIWWSKHYHFTTNEKGEFIKSENNPDKINPIIDLPFDNFAIDQENSFWAEGGDDIFDGAIKVNCMITNMDHIGVTQGYGQFWMSGKGLPRNVKAGVNKSILLEYEKDDPTPNMGFASSDPKLTELKDQVVMYVALLLTTNNLSTKSVSTDLSSSQDFPSGVSLLIDKAESVEDVQDQREIFQDNEPKIFKKIQKWQAVYKGLLTEEFSKYTLPAEFEMTLKFNDARPVMSEKEKLEVIELRQKLGINRMVDLIMIDNPQFSEKEAEEYLMEVLEDKIMQQMKAQQASAEQSGNNTPGDNNQDQNQNSDNMDQGDNQPNDESNKGAGELQQDN